MAYTMKGSPAKLGTIQGTAGHASALKKLQDKPPVYDPPKRDTRPPKPDYTPADSGKRKPMTPEQKAKREKKMADIGKQRGEKGSAGENTRKKVGKKSPAKLNPSYITTFDADGNATEKMVSDKVADATEKSGKAKGKDGKATHATVRRTGLSEYKHNMKDYNYKKASGEHFVKKDYQKSDAAKTTSKLHSNKYKKAEDALKASKSDPKVIAEEKKQAQKFPKDVKDAVKLRNVNKNRHVKDKDDQIDARGKEAHSKQQKDKLVKRTKAIMNKKANKAAQLADKKKYETKKKS